MGKRRIECIDGRKVGLFPKQCLWCAGAILIQCVCVLILFPSFYLFSVFSSFCLLLPAVRHSLLPYLPSILTFLHSFLLFSSTCLPFLRSPPLPTHSSILSCPFLLSRFVCPSLPTFWQPSRSFHFPLTHTIRRLDDSARVGDTKQSRVSEGGGGARVAG